MSIPHRLHKAGVPIGVWREPLNIPLRVKLGE
jgi:hypothetical protein